MKTPFWHGLLLIFISIQTSSKAFGLISLKLDVGKSWLDLQNSDGSPLKANGQTTDLSVMLDPIPLVPVGIGLNYSFIRLDSGTLPSDLSEAAFSHLDLDLEAWLPMFPVITPYVGYRFLLTGDMVTKTNATIPITSTESVTGNQIKIGFRKSLLPLISWFVEFNQGDYVVASFEGQKDLNFSVQSVMLGLSAGI